MSPKWSSKVTQGHPKRYGSIQRMWFPITFNYGRILCRFAHIGRHRLKIAKCIYPTSIQRSITSSEFCKDMFVLGKLEWWGYTGVRSFARPLVKCPPVTCSPVKRPPGHLPLGQGPSPVSCPSTDVGRNPEIRSGVEVSTRSQKLPASSVG